MAKKEIQPNDEKQQLIPGAEDAIREEIARNLRLGKKHETLRLEHGREETKAKKAAAALMEQHNILDFVHGEGSDKVHGYFEKTEKLKVRVGDDADEEDE